MDSRELPARPGLPEARSQAGPLQQLSAQASAAQVADAVAATWQAVHHALHPVIGQRGVLALYHRSLLLASARFPWLGPLHEGALASLDTSALHALLCQQPAAEALAAGQAMLLAFHELLCSLIGTSLTDRLLGSAWGSAPVTAPVQDKAP